MMLFIHPAYLCNIWLSLRSLPSDHLCMSLFLQVSSSQQGKSFFFSVIAFLGPIEFTAHTPPPSMTRSRSDSVILMLPRVTAGVSPEALRIFKRT
jgi:hypothetical protein